MHCPGYFPRTNQPYTDVRFLPKRQSSLRQTSHVAHSPQSMRCLFLNGMNASSHYHAENTMLLNLLGYWEGRPTLPLKKAAENLWEAAKEAGEASENELHNYRSDTQRIKDLVIEQLKQDHGLHKGPVQNAIAELNHCIEAAIKEHYRADDEKVVSGIEYFALALATEGFEGGDTRGTQIGNFRGEWRGGGF
jgi:hypothetical protein